MAIDLNKRAAAVGIILAKHNIVKAPIVRVGAALDISGSTDHLYRSGVMQETVDRLLAIAMKFDDNGEIDMWSFNTSSRQLDTASAADYGSYIKKNIPNVGGGTSYSPVIGDITEFYFPTAAKPVETKSGLFGGLFGKKEAPAAAPAPAADIPAMVMFITDGENNDKSQAERVLQAAKDKNVYWQMIGVGNNVREFEFIQRMADDLDNVGFVNLASLNVTDEVIYEQLITDEFCTWVKKQQVAA